MSDWPDEFNDYTKRVLVNYIRTVADKMGLKDWQFTVEPFKPGQAEGYIARTSIWGSDSKTATILIGEHFFKYGPRMQRETVVHELVHWHTDAMYQSATDVFENELGSEAKRISRNLLKRLHEMAVDGIASAWARQMPFIDWDDQSPLYSEYEDNTDEEPVTID